MRGPSRSRARVPTPGLPITRLGAGLTVRALRSALNVIPRRFVEGPIYQEAQQRAARIAAAG